MIYKQVMPLNKFFIVTLLLCVLVSYSLLLPVRIVVNPDGKLRGNLVQILDNKLSVTDSFVLDNQLEFNAIDYLGYLLTGQIIRYLHPLNKESLHQLEWVSLFSKRLKLEVECWCAEKTYPKQVDITLVTKHFESLESVYIPNVSVDNRRLAISGNSRAMYFLVAISSGRVGEGKKLTKYQVKEKKGYMSNVINNIYVEQ